MALALVQFGSFCLLRLRTALVAYGFLFAVNLIVALASVFSGQHSAALRAEPHAIVTIDQ